MPKKQRPAPGCGVVGAALVAALVAFTVTVLDDQGFAAGFTAAAVSVGAGLAAVAIMAVRKKLVTVVRRSRALSGVGRLLPAEIRDEYCEEWAAWMADLRADGTPRVRRWLELLSLVLIAVPRLAVGLRWAAARRAVDR